jgi:hypothetical protein
MNMKILFIIIIAATGCVLLASKNPQKSKYQKVRFSMTIPSVRPYSNGYIVVKPVTENVISGQGCVIHEVEHYETFEEDGVLMKDTTYYDMYVYQNGKPYGYMVKSFSDSFQKRIPLDSIIGVRTFKITDVAHGIKNTLLAEVAQIDAYRTVRKYAVEDAAYDSAYYYYDKRLVDIGYSYSPTFDSAYQSKLYRVDFILKKQFRERDATGKDFKMNTVELELLTVENEQVLDAFFARLKKVSSE